MKKYEIIPLKNKLDAVIELPGSKSYTNRALIIASLCNGKTVLKNALISNDIIYLIKAIRQLGIKIELNKETKLHFDLTQISLFDTNSEDRI